MGGIPRLKVSGPICGAISYTRQMGVYRGHICAIFCIVRIIIHFPLLLLSAKDIVGDEGGIRAFEQETRDLDVEIKKMKELKASYGVTSPKELRRHHVNERMSQHLSYSVNASSCLRRNQHHQGRMTYPSHLYGVTSTQGLRRSMMGEIDIDTLTIEQYLMLTQGNQAQSMVKTEFRGMMEKDIKDVTITELEYKAEMRSRVLGYEHHFDDSKINAYYDSPSLLPCFKLVQPHTEDRYKPLEEDTYYVSEDEP
ncbi:hypothetical protein Tco_0509269 [Tanacetum coccineum]